MNPARTVSLRSLASWLNRDFARTIDLCEGTLQLFKERRDTEGVVWSLLNLAAAALYPSQLAGAFVELVIADRA